MPRRLPPAASLEFERLSTELLVIARFLDRRATLSMSLTKVVEEATAERNLRGMRMLLPDVLAMLSAEGPDARKACDAELKASSQRSLAEMDSRMAARVQQVLKRGRITSEEQYYLVREWVEHADSDTSVASEVSSLWRLLEAYETVRGAAG